ncbi:MAG: PUA domain-containing protein [Thermoplasmatota archaeon]
MGDLRVRHRARMRDKELKHWNDALVASLGLAAPPLPPETERGDATPEFDLLIVNGRAFALVLKRSEGERAMLTARGLLATRPPKKFVTVDMGAIKFVMNGADVMAPGIVEADPGIAPGDLVWVRDERNKQPLAVGEAIIAGAAMPRGPKGKAIKTFHHVGDDIWNVEG